MRQMPPAPKRPWWNKIRASTSFQRVAAKPIESRLVLSDRDLYIKIRKASPEQRCRVATAGACWVVQRVGLTDRAINQAFSQLASNGSASRDVVSAVEQLVSALDARYWNLQEQAESGTALEADVLSAFALARAANSVLCALSGDPAEAAYEAITATDELPEVRNVVFSALSE